SSPGRASLAAFDRALTLSHFRASSRAALSSFAPSFASCLLNSSAGGSSRACAPARGSTRKPANTQLAYLICPPRNLGLRTGGSGGGRADVELDVLPQLLQQAVLAHRPLAEDLRDAAVQPAAVLVGQLLRRHHHDGDRPVLGVPAEFFE